MPEFANFLRFQVSILCLAGQFVFDIRMMLYFTNMPPLNTNFHKLQIFHSCRLRLVLVGIACDIRRFINFKCNVIVYSSYFKYEISELNKNHKS